MYKPQTTEVVYKNVDQLEIGDEVLNSDLHGYRPNGTSVYAGFYPNSNDQDWRKFVVMFDCEEYGHQEYAVSETRYFKVTV